MSVKIEKEKKNYKEEYNKLLDNLQKFQFASQKKKADTFFDASGYSCYENMISNFLAYIFDTNAEHGYKDLFIKSLLQVYNNKIKKVNKNNNKISKININKFYEKMSPIREYPTSTNKRIDILINGTYIIGIENKIYADLYNKLNEYYKTLEVFDKDNKNIRVAIVLSIKNVEDEISEKHFINILYKDLLKQIWKNIKLMDNNKYNIPEKWKVFIKDFLDNLDNLEEVNMGDLINIEFNNFLKDYDSKSIELFDDYRIDYDNKTKILEECSKQLESNNYEFYSGNMYSCIYKDYKNKKYDFVIEMCSISHYFCIFLWSRNEENNKKYKKGELMNIKNNIIKKSGKFHLNIGEKEKIAIEKYVTNPDHEYHESYIIATFDVLKEFGSNNDGISNIVRKMKEIDKICSKIK